MNQSQKTTGDTLKWTTEHKMFTENIMWLLTAYIAGSCATWYLFLRQNFIKATEATIDSLIDNGFLRYKRSDDGEVEILKWNETDDSEKEQK